MVARYRDGPLHLQISEFGTYFAPDVTIRGTVYGPWVESQTYAVHLTQLYKQRKYVRGRSRGRSFDYSVATRPPDEASQHYCDANAFGLLTQGVLGLGMRLCLYRHRTQCLELNQCMHPGTRQMR